MMVPLFVGREKSITALNEVMKTDKKIVLVTHTLNMDIIVNISTKIYAAEDLCVLFLFLE